LQHEDDPVVDDLDVVQRQHDDLPCFLAAYFFAAASLMCLPTTSWYAEYQSVTFSNFPPFTCQIWTSPPPSWSVAVILSGGTSPPSVKLEIFSKPFLASSPVSLPPGFALTALRSASTCSAAISTPRL